MSVLPAPGLVVFVACVTAGFVGRFDMVNLPPDARYVGHLLSALAITLGAAAVGATLRVWRARLDPATRRPVEPAEPEGDELAQYDEIVPDAADAALAAARRPLFFVFRADAAPAPPPPPPSGS